MAPATRPASSPPVRAPARLALLAGLMLLAWGFVGGDAMAQSRLEAEYEARLAGLKLGQGQWTVDAGEREFSAAARGMSVGLARIFGQGEGAGEVRGVVNGQGFSGQDFSSSLRTSRRSESTRVLIKDGAVQDVEITPPLPSITVRVPVTEAHKRNVFDPMSAALLQVNGKDDLLAPDNCKRHVAIFDGRLRYDLVFAFKRKERIAVQGYDGDALICSVTYIPLAGHHPERMATKYLAAQRDIEIWLAPIAGARILAPIKLPMPTPFGRGEIAATQFVSLPLPKTGSTSQ